MDPLTLALLAGTTTTLGNIFTGITQADQQNKAIEDLQKQIDSQTKLNLNLMNTQIEQAKQQTALQIKERKLQGARALGGQQAWLAASGLQGYSAQRLLGATRADTEKDTSIVSTNLQNYLKQAALQKKQIQAQADVQKKQLGAQKATYGFEDILGSIVKGASFVLPYYNV